MSVEVANESGVPVDESQLSELATYVLEQMDVNPLAELSVLLVDATTMEALHVRWMNEPGPTDVLAFPMDEIDTARGPDEDDEEAGPALLGDVVLCPAVAERQATEAGHSTEDELHLLCTHGVLHLLGYDHGEADEAQEMFDVQRKLLQGWQGARAGGDGR
ncbi:MAG: rRNA maturation RNase YbeY [Frankiaceae bacterium]